MGRSTQTLGGTSSDSMKSVSVSICPRSTETKFRREMSTLCSTRLVPFSVACSSGAVPLISERTAGAASQSRCRPESYARQHRGIAMRCRSLVRLRPSSVPSCRNTNVRRYRKAHVRGLRCVAGVARLAPTASAQYGLCPCAVFDAGSMFCRWWVLEGRQMFQEERVPPNNCMQPMPQTVIKFACANLPPVWCAADAKR